MPSEITPEEQAHRDVREVSEKYGPEIRAKIALAVRPAPEAGSVVERAVIQALAWQPSEDGPSYNQTTTAVLEQIEAGLSTVIAERDERIRRLEITAGEWVQRQSQTHIHAKRLEKAIGQAIDILHNNLGRQDEKVRDVEPLLLAALQQKGESDDR